jgi:hypothetical protein
VIVVGNQFPAAKMDTVNVHQAAQGAGIFRGQNIRRTKNIKGTKRYVPRVADWRSHEVKAGFKHPCVILRRHEGLRDLLDLR